MKTFIVTFVLNEQQEIDLWEVLTEGNEDWANGMVRIQTTKPTRKDMKLLAEGIHERIEPVE